MYAVLILISAIFAAALPAAANMAQPLDSPTDQMLFFNDSPNASLVEETILFKFTGDSPADARVEVSYVLENLLENEQQFDVMFVSPEFADADFEVYIDDERISEVTVDEDIGWPTNWQPVITEEIIDPVSGKPLKVSPGSWGSRIRTFSGATFPVNLKAGEPTDIKVAYNSRSGYYRYGDVINTVYTQLYYLTPARFWDGSAGVNLRIEFPEGSSMAVHSNIPLEKENDRTFVAALDGVPGSEWTFSCADTKGLIFGTNNLKKHDILVLAVTAVLLMAVPLSRRYSKNPIFTCLAVLPGAAFFFAAIKVTYGFMFLMYLLGPVILFTTIALLIFIGYKKKSGKKPSLRKTEYSNL
jgi:hypothetical protein